MRNSTTVELEWAAVYIVKLPVFLVPHNEFASTGVERHRMAQSRCWRLNFSPGHAFADRASSGGVLLRRLHPRYSDHTLVVTAPKVPKCDDIAFAGVMFVDVKMHRWTFWSPLVDLDR